MWPFGSMYGQWYHPSRNVSGFFITQCWAYGIDLRQFALAPLAFQKSSTPERSQTSHALGYWGVDMTHEKGMPQCRDTGSLPYTYGQTFQLCDPKAPRGRGSRLLVYDRDFRPSRSSAESMLVLG